MNNSKNMKKQIDQLQMVAIGGKRFAVEERNGNISFNLTAMAKAFGKFPKDWLRNEWTQTYIEKLALLQNCLTADLLKVKQGGVPERQGTWANDYRVAIRFAQWLDMDFAMQIDELVHKVLTKQSVIVEPFMGVYPTVIKHKAVYNYIEVLKALKFSTKSGSVYKRKPKHPNHFTKLYGQNFVSLDYCHFLKSRKDMMNAQLKLKFDASIPA